MHKEGTKGSKSTNLYAYFYVFQLDYATPLKSPRGDNPAIEFYIFKFSSWTSLHPLESPRGDNPSKVI